MKAYDGDLFLKAGGNELVEIKRDDDPYSPREWDNGTHFYLFNATESPDKVEVYDWRTNGMVKRDPKMYEVLEDVIGWDTLDAYHDRWVSMDYDDDWVGAWIAHLFDGELGDDIGCVDQMAELIDAKPGWFCIPVHESYGDGIIYMDPKGQKEMGTPDELVYGLLDGDVINYTNYIRKNIWGWFSYDIDGNVTDSCWGYWPDGLDAPMDTDWIGVDVTKCDYEDIDEFVEAHAYDVTLERAKAFEERKVA